MIFFENLSIQHMGGMPMFFSNFLEQFDNYMYTADMEKKLPRQQVKDWMLLVMLWGLHGLLLRFGRLLILRVF